MLYRLIDIPALVVQCALDPAWPRVTSSQREIITLSSISDSTILRLALLVHRQLLAVDGTDDEMTQSAIAPSQSATVGASRPPVGPSGDAAQPKKALAATPTLKENEKTRGNHENVIPFLYLFKPTFPNVLIVGNPEVIRRKSISI